MGAESEFLDAHAAHAQVVGSVRMGRVGRRFGISVAS
jgi:hypothetical protein